MQMTFAQLQDLVNRLQLDGVLFDVDVSLNIASAPAANTAFQFQWTTSSPTQADFPVDTPIEWRGSLFSGRGTVVKTRNDDGGISVRIFDENTDMVKRVKLSAADIASGRLTRCRLIQDDFPVNEAIYWKGNIATGPGVVIKHHTDGSISVRVTPEGGEQKRLRLNADDIASGRLSYAKQ